MDSSRTSLSMLRRMALALLGWLALVAGAFADPPGRVGRLADFTGTVWFYEVNQGEWTQAMRNRPLTTGDRLSTDRDARAELQIGSTTLRLDDDTDIEIQQLDDDNVRVYLRDGGLALRVRSSEVLREVEIITPEGRLLPLRTGHYRVDRRDDSTLAGAWSGELRFEASDSTLAIATGQRAEFWQEGPQRNTHYTWATLENDAFTQWAVAEDRRDERRSSRYVSPEMTGAEDLDRYGRWDHHAEYGAIWIPYRVSPGWAPYRYGRWGWVNPWGWTWIDEAPWGFAPFHYGRWVWWGGSWCWTPGRYVARPVYAPALVAWIGGSNVSVGVSVGSPGYVGWVPLGPREPWVPYYRASPVYVRNVNITHIHVHGDLRRVGPGLHVNRAAPGAVTVVPADTLRARQPVPQAIARVEPDIVRRIREARARPDAAPPAPVVRTVVAPGATPPPPGREADTRETRPAPPRSPGWRAAMPSPEPTRPAMPANVAPPPRGVERPLEPARGPERLAEPPAQPRMEVRPPRDWPPRRGLEPQPRDAMPAREGREVAAPREAREARETREAPAPRAMPPHVPAARIAPQPVPAPQPAPQAISPQQPAPPPAALRQHGLPGALPPGAAARMQAIQQHQHNREHPRAQQDGDGRDQGEGRARGRGPQ